VFLLFNFITDNDQVSETIHTINIHPINKSIMDTDNVHSRNNSTTDTDNDIEITHPITKQPINTLVTDMAHRCGCCRTKDIIVGVNCRTDNTIASIYDNINWSIVIANITHFSLKMDLNPFQIEIEFGLEFI